MTHDDFPQYNESYMTRAVIALSHADMVRLALSDVVEYLTHEGPIDPETAVAIIVNTLTTGQPGVDWGADAGESITPEETVSAAPAVSITPEETAQWVEFLNNLPDGEKEQRDG